MTDRRATQADLEAATRRYSTAAGSLQQPDLASPLIDAELATGGGYGVAITSTDCTPRPRYGESHAAFLRRMASYGADVAAVQREIKQRNRGSSLRQREKPDGELVYWTQCACGWCGLRVDDPEVARREYDAHVCAAENIGQDAVTRAQASVDRPTIVKRTGPAVLQPSIVGEAADEKPVATAQGEDEAAQRFALLELER